MKLNKSNIFALMTLGGLMAFGQIASAEDQTPAAPATPPPADAPPAGGRAGARANLEKVFEQIGLTDEQKEKVKPVLKDSQEKLKALRGDTTLTPEDRKPKVKEIREATDAKLKTIMTADQFAQWQKLSPMNRNRGRRNQNNPPPAADAPTTPPATGGSK